MHEQGYTLIEQSSPWNVVFADQQGRTVDIHVFVENSEGAIVGGILYPKESLTGAGVIDGRTVRCICLEYMVKFKTGYTVRQKDFNDILLLAETFGIEIPKDYDPFFESSRKES